MQKILENKKIAVFVAFRDFRDIEYFIPKDILQRAGAEITTFSTKKGMAVGDDGGEVLINMEASQLKIDDFDALVFIGGAGMGKEIDNELLHEIVKEAVRKNKVLGAICIAPALLAKAGALKDKRATIWAGPMDQSAVKLLKEAGVKYEEKDVVVDGKIVTAFGPPAAQQFGEALIGVLTSF